MARMMMMVTGGVCSLLFDPHQTEIRDLSLLLHQAFFLGQSGVEFGVRVCSGQPLDHYDFIEQ